MKKILLAILAVAAGTIAGAAQQAATDSVLTLERCRELAMQNNAAIRMAGNDAKGAAELRKEAFTKYFPEISAGASAFWANHDMLQYDVLDLFTLGLIKKGRAAGIFAVQPVFMGGQIVNGNKLARVGEEAAVIKREGGKRCGGRNRQSVLETRLAPGYARHCGERHNHAR